MEQIMRKQIIVLHVVGRMDRGGAESRIMDLYRHIDREKVQFIFMQHTSERCAFEEEVESLGGKVYHVPRFNVKNYFAYKKAWKDFFEKHPEIQVVHGHMTSTAAIYLPIAKKAGVKVTIAHARSAGVDPGVKGKLTKFLRRNLYRKCDCRFTCSEIAGEAVFGNQKQEARRAVFIPNAIEVDKFEFSQKMREEIRKELNIENCFVIGHVGRFAAMKNHKYMIEILEQCAKLEQEKQLPETKMMFLGDGSLKEEIQKLAEEKGLDSKVLFLGNRKDVHRYYQAMDYFLLPSFYEGLPGTAIEAQASGLPGILSDAVTDEAVITKLMQQRSVQESAAYWAEEIIKCYTAEKAEGSAMTEFRSKVRGDYAKEVKEASFDVKEQAKKMQEFYLVS